MKEILINGRNSKTPGNASFRSRFLKQLLDLRLEASQQWKKGL